MASAAAAPKAAPGKPTKEPPKSFARRDQLRANELAAQAAWASSKEFETDAPSVTPAPSKFMVTFPYPYMNGRLHLGHAFSLSKAEFAAGYQRMLGKSTLFPFAFHCTGMPIHAAAQKLKREIATGTHIRKAAVEEPDDEAVPPAAEAAVASESPAAPAAAAKTPGVFKGKKSKVAAKTGDALTQWEILEKSGIAPADIPAFQDSRHWLDYFPALGVWEGWSLHFPVMNPMCRPYGVRRSPLPPTPPAQQARRTLSPSGHTSTGGAPSSLRPSTRTTTRSSAGRCVLRPVAENERPTYPGPSPHRPHTLSSSTRCASARRSASGSGLPCSR